MTPWTATSPPNSEEVKSEDSDIFVNALEASSNRVIGCATQREVKIPRTIANMKAKKHNKIVVRVLALICSIKSASGMATTISQSRPRPSCRGATVMN